MILRFLILALFCFTSTILNAQRTVDAEIILIDSDTINVKVEVVTNIFWPDKINELSINKVMRAVVNNSIVKLYAEDIQQLKFVDFKNNDRLFIQKDGWLQEQKFSGKKINWFRDYRRNSYDASIIMYDLIVNEFGEKIYFDPGGMSKRKQLKQIIKHYPKLIPFVDTMKMNDESYLELMIIYEEN